MCSETPIAFGPKLRIRNLLVVQATPKNNRIIGNHWNIIGNYRKVTVFALSFCHFLVNYELNIGLDGLIRTLEFLLILFSAN